MCATRTCNDSRRHLRSAQWSAEQSALSGRVAIPADLGGKARWRGDQLNHLRQTFRMVRGFGAARARAGGFRAPDDQIDPQG